MGLFESSIRLCEIKKCQGITPLDVDGFGVLRVLRVLSSTLCSGACWVSA